MSDQVTFAQTLQFTTNVKHLLQQQGSKLRNTVMQGAHTGKGAVPVEQIGATNAQERTTRHGDTPIIDTPHARRWVFPTDYEWGDMVDKQDASRTLIDPRSPYTQAGVNALGRKIDDLIIASFDATSVVGAASGGGDTATEAFDTAFEINNLANLRLQEVRQTLELFMAQDLDVDREELFFVVGPSQWESLLAETTVTTSIDFVNSKPNVSGKLPNLFGFNFIVSNRLPLVGANRTVFAYAKSGVHLGMWNDIEVKADVRPDKGFNWQLYARLTAGATRLEQGRVIRVICAE